MHIIFKSTDEHREREIHNRVMIEDLQQKYAGLNYDDYEFPSGGQI